MKLNWRLVWLIALLLCCAAATAVVIVTYRPPPEDPRERNYSEWLSSRRKRIRALMAEQHYPEAERLIRNYLDYVPDDNEMRRLLGKILFDGGNRAGALKVYYAALMRDPTDFIARNNFAVALLYNRRADEALREFSDAYEASDREWFIGMNLAAAYRVCGDAAKSAALKESLSKQYPGKSEVPFDALRLGDDVGNIPGVGKTPAR